MLDSYERLQKIDQALNEEDGFLSTLNKKVDRQMDKIPAIPPGILQRTPYAVPFLPRPLQKGLSNQIKTFMTGTPPKMSYQSNEPYERPKLATRSTDPGMSQLTPSQRLAARQSPRPEPYDPQPHKKNVLTRGEYFLRNTVPTEAGKLYGKHNRTAAKISLGIGATALAALAARAGGGPLITRALQSSPRMGSGGGGLLARTGAGRLLGRGGGISGVRQTASKLSKQAIDAVKKSAVGRMAQRGGIRSIRPTISSTAKTISSTARNLGSKALGTVRKTTLGRLMTGKFAQAVGREAAIYGVLNKIGVFGGGDGGAGDEAGVDDIGTKKLKPKSIGDLDATSAGRDFEAEYGGTSLKKLRGK